MKKVLVIVTVIVIIALFAAYKCSRSRGAENVETLPETSQPAPVAEPAQAVEEAPAQNEEPSEEVKEEPAPEQKEEPAPAPAPVKKEKKEAKPAAEKVEPVAEKPAPKAAPEEKKPLAREEKAAPERPMPEVKRAPSDANIDSAGVTKVINVSRAAIKRCYDKALMSNPQLKGKMSVKIVINQQGRVDSTEVVDDSLRDAEVAKCVRGVIGRLRFPKPAEGTATVTFPFAFDPKNQ
jgi:Predicted membrane protein